MPSDRKAEAVSPDQSTPLTRRLRAPEFPVSPMRFPPPAKGAAITGVHGRKPDSVLLPP